jgi:chlorite dismutase
VTTLAADTEGAPTQLQAFIVGGDKADFGVMLLDPDPLKIDSIHQRLISGPLGAYLRPAYSFVSMTEVSEYVPTLEQYGDQLVEGGVERDSEMFTTKLNAYQQREPMMRKQRLTPDLPAWPAMCFYPMNKKRKVGENWFTEPFAARKAMMSEHAKSGMAFAGKVTQLITVSVGFDDWEWGVTLWAKNPEFLKEIVYKMRFDEASARYAEFGPFYVGYVATAQAILAHCRVG